MFGYVRPVKEELKLRELDRYRAAYCGICRTLGKKFGFMTRFFVNYDVTFLYCLLASVNEACPVRKCFCPARVVCRKPCVDDEEILTYVAAIDVILSRHKLSDDVADHGLIRGLPYRLARALTARGYRRAKRQLPAFDETVRRQLDRLNELEAERSASLDATADTFAVLLSACADYYPAAELRKPLEQLLYHVGRHIYLVDALDDLARDCKKDNYNPLRYRFKLKEDKLDAEDLLYFEQILDASVNLAGAAFELLPTKTGRGLLENVIYLGLPVVRRSVINGSFHEKYKI